MKKFALLSLILMLVTGLTVNAQKYKTAADTVKLNAAIASLNLNIAQINTQLAVAQNDLILFRQRSFDANAHAETAAAVSSNSAARATNGDVGDARNSKRKARKSLNSAQTARTANGKVTSTEKKINKLNSDLIKKQGKLQELETVRASLRATV